MSNSAEQVRIRDVQPEDLPIFYDHQLEPEAVEMAAFPSRDRGTFMKHWQRIMKDDETITQTILYNGEVAGNIVSAVYSDKREIGYWLGRAFWDKGIGTRALAEFLRTMAIRPVYAHVATHNIASIRVLEKNGFQVVREQRNLMFMKLADAS